jgi:4-hydroxy-3-methylbut-2-enyl diphosphate reductase
MAVAPEVVHLVEDEEDLRRATAAIAPGTPVALLAQTTLSHDEWSDLVERARESFPDLWMPGRSDLCFATTNRQAALREIAGRADAVVVIGSANSSNTVALAKVAQASGCPRVLRINGAEELPDNLTGIVGVTAGASAPDRLVVEVIERLDPARGVTTVVTVEEDEYFPPPPELRDLLRQLEDEGRPGISDALLQDRTTSAAEVLDELAGRL